MSGGSVALDILAGIGQLIVVLVLSIVLYKIGKFVDALAEMIKKD